MVDCDQDPDGDETGVEKRDLDLRAEQVIIKGRCEDVFPDGTETMGPERNERLGFVGLHTRRLHPDIGLERATRHGLEGKPYRYVVLGLNVGRKIGSLTGRARDRVVDRTDVLLLLCTRLDDISAGVCGCAS